MLLEALLRHAGEAFHQRACAVRVKREDIKWALVDYGDQFFGDEEGVVLFETRKEARKYATDFARFYRQHEIDRPPPRVVKVSVRVEEIKTVEVIDEE